MSLNQICEKARWMGPPEPAVIRYILSICVVRSDGSRWYYDKNHTLRKLDNPEAFRIVNEMVDNFKQLLIACGYESKHND